MNDQEHARRFDRLETKIDKLTEVLTNVARVEEKLVGADARLKRHEFRLDENERKIDEIEDNVASNSQLVKIGQALAASIWVGLVSVVVYLFKD
jgi:chromosome segregation ATPase